MENTKDIYNIIEEINLQIRKVVENSIRTSIEKEEIPNFDIPDIDIEVPREKNFGDFSSNIAMKSAKYIKRAPRQIAELLINNMDLSKTYIKNVKCAGPGFINFYLSSDWLYDAIYIIQEKKEHYGEIQYGKKQKVMVEFVSANPTGPLHMGNARGGALGDLIAEVLTKAGYKVTKEFYINDAGNQIEKFGASLEARYLQQILGEDAVDFPEDGYHGDDIIKHAQAYINKYGDSLVKKSTEERQKALVDFALPRNIERMKKALEDYGIKYDVWFSEKSLYENGELDETISFLIDNGYTLEKEGAIWLDGGKAGIEKDEVLIRKNGHPTYLAADIAYHRNKFIKRKFDKVINLWGADHHGHVSRMKAAMSLFGIDPDRLHVVLFQLVRLYRNGELVRMSKRTGKAISLIDLIEEAGKDAARFFFNMKTSGSHLDFDLNLAVEQSNDNPVFYVQYAHARICSILRRLEEEGIKFPQINEVDLSLLKENEEIQLMKRLSEYPENILISAKTLEPSRLTRYVHDIASDFHSFYNACRVKGVQRELMNARIILVDSARIVIKNVLELLKITAPERM